MPERSAGYRAAGRAKDGPDQPLGSHQTALSATHKKTR